MGYHGAGFDVVGVDIAYQPRYPFKFWHGDALASVEELVAEERIDAIHASPPCQHYANVTRWTGDQETHPDYIADVRELLNLTGLPWVIENVRTDELRPDFLLCGTGLGLRVRRHRYFETNWSGIRLAHPCYHRSSDYSFDHGGKQPESVYRDAMGCGWMTVQESREAVPPAYTEFIGHQLLAHIETVAA